MLPLLSQTILLWQVLLAVTVMKKRLGIAQASGSWAADMQACMLAVVLGHGLPRLACTHSQSPGGCSLRAWAW